MTSKLAIPLIFALSASTAVFAQDTNDDQDAADQTSGDQAADYGTGGVPLNWDEETTESFFADPGAEILLTDGEIMANWAGLTPEQQQIVREHCQDVMMSSMPADGTQPVTEGMATDPATDTGVTTGVGTDTGATTGVGTDPGVGTTTGLGAGTGAGASMQMMQLCELLEGM